MHLYMRRDEARKQNVIGVDDGFAACELKRVEIGAELSKILVEMDNAEAGIVAGVFADDVPAVVR